MPIAVTRRRVTAMSHHWPDDVQFTRLELVRRDRDCPDCERYMHVCDHRHHRVFTMTGPLHIVSKLVHCPDDDCPGHHKTYSPEEEMGITMPWWTIAWDVFAWIGFRRFARHWSVPQLRHELSDSYGIDLSEDAIENCINRYRTMVAARHQDPAVLAEEYRDVKDSRLSIDGLQPEKGHETLYVVRELRNKRVWFAESLISSSTEEVKHLFERAKKWAERLGIPVAWWMSDKQEAFVKCIADVFPGTPHRYCRNHFMQDLAKPVLERDSRAKKRMRGRIRGLREIEREVLEERREEQKDSRPDDGTDGAETDVTLDYCTAVRGILNDSQGGPLHPTGIRMADALGEVRESLGRNLDAKKGGRGNCGSRASRSVSTAGSRRSRRSRRKSASG